MTEKLFVDSNPFIYFLSDVKDKADIVQKFFKNKNYELHTSYAVLNEVKFRLLMNKAIEELKTTKKYELIKSINSMEDLRISVIERYLKFFTNIIHLIKILDMDSSSETLSCSMIMEKGLLPTDASIAALMLNNNINKILTDDSDFKKVESIEVIEV